MNKQLNLGICQIQVTNDKSTNLRHAGEMIKSAVRDGAEMVVLPEVFNVPYVTSIMASQAEVYPGETARFLSETARKNRCILVGGSIPERSQNGDIFNTSYTFDQDGNLIGAHRKIHLFDIDIPGQITFKESKVFTAGNTLEIIRYQDLCIGTIICYDIRFPELARLLTQQGANMLIVPAAFNMTTGPAHWDLLMRSRAIDNQLFVVAASPARNPEASYHAWGHSMVVDPWGMVMAEAGHGEEILNCRLDFSVLDRVRKEMPLLNHRRTDLYDVCKKTSR